MISSQDVSLSVSTANSFQITSQKIEEDLRNPESLLYQDLYNGRMNALTRKRAIRKAEYQYNVTQELQRQLDELEEDLAQQRELANAYHRDNLEHYYAEQLLMRKEAGLPIHSKKTSADTSLESDVRQLIATEAHLYFLKNQREALLQNYAEKQKVYANAFTAELNSQFNLDANTLPKEVKEIDNQVIERMTERKPFDDTLKKLGPDHVVNQMIAAEEGRHLYEARRTFNNTLLTSIILRPSASARLKISMYIHDEKRSTDVVNVIVNKTMIAVETFNPDRFLVQNEIETAKALAERMFIQARIHAEMNMNEKPEADIHSSLKCSG